jgi:sulfate transport system permease protein
MVMVGLPLAALLWEAASEGSQSFWDSVSSPEAVAALKLTLVTSLGVSFLNAVLGTITAWVLVRDEFRGKSVVNAIIDLPFALPTIVAGLTLLALYGPTSPVGINVAFTKTAIVLALMFVTLPFVVRTVQPVLQELDSELEEAAHTLGASQWRTFRRIVLPTILPGILSGVALAFAKAVGEFGSLVIITGNIPFETQVSAVYIFGRIESGDPAAASAVAVVLLAISFLTLLSIGTIRRFATRHEDA